MKNFRFLVLFWIVLCVVAPAGADDTCIFSVTSDDVPPNVVLLLDNGAAMEGIITHPAYDAETDYTPVLAQGVSPSEGVNGFFHDPGYWIHYQNTNNVFIRKIDADLTPDTANLVSNSGAEGLFTINGRTVTLPHTPSDSPDADGIKDNAGRFRYGRNYLNWIFFGPYAEDGSDLPSISRFYHAKKAILETAASSANRANFAIFNFAGDDGASSVQPLKTVVETPLAENPDDNILNSEFRNAVNNMGTVTWSPLAEGLATIGDYMGSSQIKQYVSEQYCQKNFVIVITPGFSSADGDSSNQAVPGRLMDYDGDDAGIGEGRIELDGVLHDIPVNSGGTTHLDDVAFYLYDNDVVYSDTEAWKNLATYTVGVQPSPLSRAFLINASNNGNGHVNLYDTADPEYGTYHFDAADPDDLATALQTALSSILSKTTTFTAPVVPVTRTTSGTRIYLAFFKPLDGNFWQGNVAKYGLSASNEILDRNGEPATWPNGAMKEGAEPYWATIDWANPFKSNYMAHDSRRIYTILAGTSDLGDPGNAFATTNEALDAAALGNPSAGISPRDDLINYIRGADSYDEDGDGDRTENRSLITADALHSEPAVFSYTYQSGSEEPAVNDSETWVYYGANDGMLHAVSDSDGKEEWGFIPPDSLPRLKAMVEGGNHQFYVDSSPRVFFMDHDEDGYIDDLDGDGLLDAGDDRIILVVGQRKGGRTYSALDVTRPESPKHLWELTPDDVGVLGQTWSEPQFGKVKTTDTDTEGTFVMIVGAGFSPENTSGNAVLAVDVVTGEVVRTFRPSGMDRGIVSNVTLIDADDNGFIDKAYVGDLGGRMWRLGKFEDAFGDNLVFPRVDENIMNWTAQILFTAGCDESVCTDGVDNDGDGLVDEPRRFYYPPDIGLEFGYDLVLAGTGDREIACAAGTSDRIFAVKDNHRDTLLDDADLVDLSAGFNPNLDLTDGDIDENYQTDKGWYYPLADGEKVLSKGVLFYKAFYVTTFLPNTEPCVPGGYSYLYALQYKTGASWVDFDDSGTVEEKTLVGGGIASRPVPVIRDDVQTLLISVGSTNADSESGSTDSGIAGNQPPGPPDNFFTLWWKNLFE
ncbi:MAG: PilC/PilY family type IV pilus protein [Desulfuromonadales bacterium]